MSNPGVAFSEIYTGRRHRATRADLVHWSRKEPRSPASLSSTRALPTGDQRDYQRRDRNPGPGVCARPRGSPLRTIARQGWTQSARGRRVWPSLTPARRSPSAALTRPCATTRVLAGCSRMTARGKDAIFHGSGVDATTVSQPTVICPGTVNFLLRLWIQVWPPPERAQIALLGTGADHPGRSGHQSSSWSIPPFASNVEHARLARRLRCGSRCSPAWTMTARASRT